MGEYRVVCCFCSMQDELVLSEDDLFESAYFGSGSFVRAHYGTGVRRLCARGNFCVELSQHKRRTSYAKVDGEEVPAQKAVSELVSRIEQFDKSRVALLLGGSLPLEDALLAARLGEAWGTRFVALAAPEDYISAKLQNKFAGFDELAKKQLIVVFGDVFSLHPTVARAVHDARFAERRNAFVCVDNCRTRTSWFAYPALVAMPGKVADAAEALAKAAMGEQFSIDGLGVAEKDFEQTVNLINGAESGAVLFAPGVGHFAEPLRVGFWARRLAEAKGFDFVAFGTTSNGRGIARLLSTYGFATITETLDALSDGQIDAVLCLGCDPVEAFPKSFEHIRSAGFVATTATLPTAVVQNSSVVIPSLHLFERKGTLLSLDERLVSVDESFPAPDYPGEEGVLRELLRSAGVDDSVPQGELEGRLGGYEFISEPPEPHSIPAGDVFAVGYSAPYHHGDGSITRRINWVIRNVADDGNVAIVGPALAERLGVGAGSTITVETAAGKSAFSVSVAEDQVDNVVLVPTYMPNARSVLGWCSVAGFIPAAATVSKA